MIGTRAWLRVWSPSVLVIACAVAGCGGQSASADRFVPKSELARSAVETALTAWQAGDTACEFHDSSPRIQLVDTHRLPTQRLKSFQILGEVGSDSGRCFSVRVTLEDPAEEQRIRYLVFGIDPLWVFREEDFHMLSHWDHSMPDSIPVAAEQSAGNDAGSNSETP